ncbi:hypothetical protein, variant 2 [Capsaspora owczarzaki ATCC 30864]|nr:hypothetical protein, variant 2 [Capsaspora owczarzaki ATCC 30864]
MLTVDATLLGAVRLNVGGLFQFSGSINVDSPHRETGTFLPSRVPVGSTTSVSTSLTSATASTASSHDPMEVAPNPELDHRDHPARPAIRMFPPVSDDSVVHVTNPAIVLRAKTGRCVDGMDLRLYSEALEIRRQTFQDPATQALAQFQAEMQQ